MIGRVKEQGILRGYYESGRPEFVAIYGRRRVGKTYLVRHFFENKFFFETSGEASRSKLEQLNIFNDALIEYGADSSPLSNWREAFVKLKRLILQSPSLGRKALFIDELPWLDTHKSGFIPALEHFWNSFASTREDILLIACGSATSWIINNLINNHGGLHNRLTGWINLEPFTLRETTDYLRSRGIESDNFRTTELYMVLGGVPYYMDFMKKNLSIPQNIDEMCFSKNAPLKHEFNRLYQSLFKHSENHIRIVRALSERRSGFTRKEIAQATGITEGGGLTGILAELELCGFIQKRQQFGKKKNGAHYCLVDFFSIFSLRFMGENDEGDRSFWVNNYDSALLNAWRGLAFERVCMAHRDDIKAALGIAGVAAVFSSWQSKQIDKDAASGQSSHGAQIDMVIDRKDGVINLCEIKYSSHRLGIDKEYDLNLRNKSTVFREVTGTKKTLHRTMITTFGITQNLYSDGIQSEVTLDAFFDD